MTKVLVVDDSALMRRTLGQLLQGAGMAVETARNGREAVERLVECEPDVVTLDVNMPDMDGLTSLSLMMQVRPTPVVMVSSLTEQGALATLEAMALGAVDCVAKPGGTISLNLDQVAHELIAKVRAAAGARLGRTGRSCRERTPSARSVQTRHRSEALGAHAPAPAAKVHTLAPQSHKGMPEGLVVIGVSTGGPRTLEDVLPQLPAHFPWPVLLAQHMPANFTGVLARRMDAMCPLSVVEVDRPMRLQAGTVYVARGGSDMVVAPLGAELCVRPAPESGAYPWHPSVSRLMESSLQHMDATRLVGVLLTGMGDDGAKPMADLRRKGGRTIAESADTAVVFGMPHELIAQGGASAVLPCQQIAAQLCDWLLADRSQGA